MKVLACFFARRFIGYSETTSGCQEMQGEERVYSPGNVDHYLGFVGDRLSDIDGKRN
ncbi:hypothetical protein ACFPU0_16605 [Pseudomonas sp. GCM10022186]|uniref:hypothetical protein n=1 Tax=Pseudomonas sp. GCM10022186 TaxID=3252650 RepID=UPI0036224D2A